MVSELAAAGWLAGWLACFTPFPDDRFWKFRQVPGRLSSERFFYRKKQNCRRLLLLLTALVKQCWKTTPAAAEEEAIRGTYARGHGCIIAPDPNLYRSIVDYEINSVFTIKKEVCCAFLVPTCVYHRIEASKRKK